VAYAARHQGCLREHPWTHTPSFLWTPTGSTVPTLSRGAPYSRMSAPKSRFHLLRRASTDFSSIRDLFFNDGQPQYAVTIFSRATFTQSALLATLRSYKKECVPLGAYETVPRRQSRRRRVEVMRR
jgi:hypothetical protein